MGLLRGDRGGDVILLLSTDFAAYSTFAVFSPVIGIGREGGVAIMLLSRGMGRGLLDAEVTAMRNMLGRCSRRLRVQRGLSTLALAIGTVSIIDALSH